MKKVPLTKSHPWSSQGKALVQLSGSPMSLERTQTRNNSPAVDIRARGHGAGAFANTNRANVHVAANTRGVWHLIHRARAFTGKKFGVLCLPP